MIDEASRAESAVNCRCCAVNFAGGNRPSSTANVTLPYGSIQSPTLGAA